MTRLLLALCMLAGLAWLAWSSPAWLAPDEIAEPSGVDPESASLLGGREVGAATPESDAAHRTAHELRFRVRDAATGRGIPDARIDLFDRDDQHLGELRTDATGEVSRPTDRRIDGWVASRPGYQMAAAEGNTTELALRTSDFVTVHVHDVDEDLLEDYELLASIRIDATGYPNEHARRLMLKQANPPAAIQDGTCRLERPLAAMCTTSLYGRHRATGKTTEFDRYQTAVDESRVDFRTASYAKPTGAWLKLSLRIPSPWQRKVSRYRLEHFKQSVFWVRVQSGDFAKGSSTVDRDFVELAPGRYRVVCHFAEGRSLFHSVPFRLRGGLRRDYDLRNVSGATLTVQTFRPDGRRLDFDDLRLRGVAGAGCGYVRARNETGSIHYSGLAAGTYRLDGESWSNSGTFLPRRLQLRASGHTQLNIVLRPAGRLHVEVGEPAAQYAVFATDTGEVVRGFVRYDRTGRRARIPRGRYTVKIGTRPEEIVVVGAGVSYVGRTPATGK